MSGGLRVTGLGSWPGTNFDQALAQVARIWSAAPEGAICVDHLLELPARGPQAQMIGRAAGLLVDLPVEHDGTDWRLATRPSRQQRAAREQLAQDLDSWAAWRARHGGPDGFGRASAGLASAPISTSPHQPQKAVKIQLTGPITLAAGLWLARGERVLSDPVATADLAVSLAEGLAEHVSQVSQQTGVDLVWVQLDEPGLGAAIVGSVPTFSGLNSLAPVAAETAAGLIGRVRSTLPGVTSTALHCCDPTAPTVSVARQAGFNAVSLDLTNLTATQWDKIGQGVDAGLGLAAGLGLPKLGRSIDRDQGMTKDHVVTALTRPSDYIGRRLKALGLDPAWQSQRLVLSPPCGLAGATPDQAIAHLTALTQAAADLASLAS